MNVAFLEKGVNQDIGALSYGEKLGAFRKSGFLTTKRIVDMYETWTESTIDSRQKGFARLAKSIWRIDF